VPWHANILNVSIVGIALGLALGIVKPPLFPSDGDRWAVFGLHEYAGHNQNKIASQNWEP
jgi:hypothetical protein